MEEDLLDMWNDDPLKYKGNFFSLLKISQNKKKLIENYFRSCKVVIVLKKESKKIEEYWSIMSIFMNYNIFDVAKED